MHQSQYWKIETLWGHSLQNQKGKYNFSDIKPKKPFFQKEKFSPKPSKKNVFWDEHSKGYTGIGEYQCIFDHQKKPVYLFDNHNIALLPFLEIKNFLGEKLDVVHIDAHRDDAIFPGKVPLLTSQNIEKVLEKSRVSDYLDIATRGGLIGNITSLTQEKECENFLLPKNPFILNLDLDIFGEEGSCIPLETKVKTIAKAWSKAEVVLLATSPGYMSQEDAFLLAKIFSKPNI